MTTKSNSQIGNFDYYFSKIWSPQGIMFFIGITFVTAGYGAIGDFVNWILERPYIPEMNFEDIYFQYGFILLSIFCLINQTRLFRRKYHYSNILNSVFVFAIILWLIFRTNPPKGWYFIRLNLIPEIYLWDILFFTNLIHWVISFHKNKLLRGILNCLWGRIKYSNPNLKTKLCPTKNKIFYFYVITISWLCLFSLINDLTKSKYEITVFFIGIIVIIAIYTLKFLVYLYLTLSDLQSNNNFSNNNFFSEDIPIAHKSNNNHSETFLQIAKDLAIKITNQNFTKAFSVGIVGAWGAGKSSFINHVLQVATEQYRNNKKIEIIEFYPAYNHSPEQIINDFFETLISSLKKYDARLKSTLLSYSLKLVEATVNKKRDFQTILSPDNHLMRKRPICQLYNEISEIIKSLPVKPIIVIDDIDRLKSDEILEVLRIIRNTANFPNTVFLVAFDKKFIVESLMKENPCFTNNYIDKYFQLELHLPQNKSKDLRLYFLNLLHKRFKKVNSNKKRIFYQIKDAIADPEIVVFDKFCNNHRDVIRIHNSFILHVDLLKAEEEIHYIDLLYFIILKSKFNSATNCIYKKFLDFFYLDKNENRWFYIQEKDNKDPVKNKSSVIEAHFKNDPKLFNLSSSDLEELLLLLKTLFGDFDSKSPKKSDAELRITAPNRTDIYFNLLLDSNSLPRVEFLNYINTYPHYEFLTYIKELTNAKTNSILTKEVDKEINSYNYSKLKSLNQFNNVIATDLYLKSHDLEIISLLKRLISYTDDSVRNISNVLGFHDNLIQVFGLKNEFNISLEKRFDIYDLISNNLLDRINPLNNSKSTSETFEKILPLRKQLVKDLFSSLNSIDIKYSNWIFSHLKSVDIENKTQLTQLFEYFRINKPNGSISLSELTHEESHIIDFFKIIDAKILISNGVVKDNSELVEIYKKHFFLHKDLPYEVRVFPLKRFLDDFEFHDIKKMGFKTKLKIKNLHSSLYSTHLNQNPPFNVDLIKLTVDEMSIKNSGKVREAFKRLLFQSEENLKFFLETCTYHVSKNTVAPKNAIEKIFLSILNFKNTLEQSSFKDFDFVKEYIEFLDVHKLIVEYSIEKLDTVFNFRILQISDVNTEFNHSSDYLKNMLIIKLKDHDIPANLNIHDNNKSLFYLDNGNYILLYNPEDNFNSIAKNYNQVYSDEVLSLKDGKLKINEKILGEIYYSSQDDYSYS